METFKINSIILFSILLILSCKAPQQEDSENLSIGQSDESSLATVSHGKIERLENFKSDYISARHIDIWLPKNYDGERKFNVLYMHDAQMLFDSSKTWNKQEWGVDETLTELMDKSHISNTLVVGIWNSGNRHGDYFPDVPGELISDQLQDSLNVYLEKQKVPNFLDSLKSFDYVSFIAKELKPYIDANYAVNPEFNNTFIGGSSMGGLISMYALCEFPESFGGAICMSTHWPGFFESKDNPIPSYFIAYMQENLPEGGTHKIYFDYGTETLDTLYEIHQKRVDALMVEKGYPDKFWMTKKFEGHDHSEKSWRKRLDYPMSFMLGGP